jgi:hypothetical protein
MFLRMLPSQVLRLPDDFQHVAFDYVLIADWLKEHGKPKTEGAQNEDLEKLKDMEVWRRRQLELP